jgi:hypothetical protein
VSFCQLRGDPAEPDVGQSRVEVDDEHRQQRRSAAHLSAGVGISRSVGPRFIFASTRNFIWHADVTAKTRDLEAW